ncbi:hypothetical protein [Lignipirellula cremea]|uniref:Uncharacterized protein n=1 Tax=Lignipirellula cremea TaxID=2528010 RepID=A0A518E0I6_9BACT|nr:hypothetical protein [Lignipirellula cremea]QDU97606.1 hypothetical protein Pla8534_54560 [Lignipirellula cremea]
MKKLYSGLLEIVDQQCNAEQISHLLRKIKETSELAKSEIRCSGKKSVLIENVSRAIGRGLISTETVHDLVRDCEENGAQHIFLYRPTSRVVKDRLSDGTEVAEKLFGECWGPDYFPIFDRREEELVWVDFRMGLAGKPKDWIAKIYGHERHYKVEKRTKETISSTAYREVIDYTMDNYSTVLLFRWNHPDLLEVRIDQHGGQKSGVIDDRLNSALKMFSEVVAPDDLPAYSLSHSITDMIRNRVANKHAYAIGSVKLLDVRRGIIEFHPYDPEEELDAENGRSNALDQLIKSAAVGHRLAIQWKPCGDTPQCFPGNGLLTTATGAGCNDLVVSSKTTAPVLNYVTNKLR